MLFSSQITTPMLTTLHGKPTPVFSGVLDHYHGYFNCISFSHAQQFPSTGCLGVVHHGIDIDTFPFSAEKSDHLLYLSRISPEKGPLIAIEVARRLGKKLVMAGKISRHDRPYFEEQVKPEIDGEQIVFVGEADARMKRELFVAASCFLMPILWDEPFGLVMVEAMACGTPVVALRRGSAPELIAEGRTGYVVDTAEEMIEAVRCAELLRPEDCRAHVERYFSVERMADDYLAMYEQVMQSAGTRSLHPAA
jgi:glycosyltransferase involved in cell wall biosynthesis